MIYGGAIEGVSEIDFGFFRTILCLLLNTIGLVHSWIPNLFSLMLIYFVNLFFKFYCFSFSVTTLGYSYYCSSSYSLDWLFLESVDSLIDYCDMICVNFCTCFLFKSCYFFWFSDTLNLWAIYFAYLSMFCRVIFNYLGLPVGEYACIVAKV